MKRLHIALVYNASLPVTPEVPEDQGGTIELRRMIRSMARALRTLGHKVRVVPLAGDLMAFLRRLQRLKPDIVFNQYDDVVHGAIHEMRVAALLPMMGYRMTGSHAIALGVCRYKYMTATLLQGAGIPIPPETELVERVSDGARRRWHFPLIVQAGQEHAGIGLDRHSVVHTKTQLMQKVRQVLTEFNQPALVQRFLSGREFNVGIIGGRRLRVLPLAEVDYAALPAGIPPIMSYAAKWLQNSVEYKRTKVICPAAVEPDLAREISRTAIRAFRAVGGWGYGRVDIRLDEAGVARVLDVNCNCSLEADVGLARSALQAGIAYPRVLQMIIDAACQGLPGGTDVPMV
jgi:D-alanine-D-alanine ligase